LIISVASGKGGTGKTTVATNLALVVSQWEKTELIDADVEEPNAHLFLRPLISEREDVTVPVPEIDKARCDYCARCAEVCAWGAITVIRDAAIVFPELCHGCGGCALLCPRKAITEKPRTIGVVERGRARGIVFAHGRLNPGEALTVPLSRSVRRDAATPGRVVIIDAPPGTACPAVEAVKDTDFTILVTEPTPFGLNDLALAVEMTRKLGLRTGVVINRSDLGDDRVDRYCERENLLILARFPNDLKLARAYARGVPAVLASPRWKRRFEALAEQVISLAKGAA